MRIGYLLAQFPVLSQTFVINELIELIDRGHEVYIFSLSQPKTKALHPEVERYGLVERAYYLPGVPKLTGDSTESSSWTGVLSNVYGGNTRRARLLSEVFDRTAAQRIARKVDELGLDVLHAHFYGLPSGMAALVSQKTGVPYTFTCHAVDIFVEPNADVMRRHMEAAAKVITVSEYNKRYLRRVTGVAEDRIEVVRACSILDIFSFLEKVEEEGSILSVGRLVEKKGLKYGLRAVTELVGEFPNLNYRIAGDGPLMADLKALVGMLGLEENVVLLGPVGHDAVRRELSRASVALLPCVEASNGDRDAIPVALQEAMCAGIPVVSTTLGSIPELVEDGRNGYLVPPCEVNGLTAALDRLLRDRMLRRRMGEDARTTIQERFNIHSEAEKLLRIWEDTAVALGARLAVV